MSQTMAELEQLVESLGEKRYRAKQIFIALHRDAVQAIDEMTTLSKDFRSKLSEIGYINTVKEVRRQVSADGTVKLLLELLDGECVESVAMQYKHGISLCISTQVGCRQGCVFCASTLGGLVRNLTSGEILSEVYGVERILGCRISSIVLMGIGEPLDNFDNVVKFIELLGSPDGRCLSSRHISLSTCGLVPQINMLADRGLGLTLSISLHASDNATRSKLMPINRLYPIEELLDACKRYFAKTGRRISFEYALIAGENDSIEQADALANLLRGQLAHVNLIPVNAVAERTTRRGSRKSILEFCERLRYNGINATIRRELGSDIDAACGQLRRSNSKANVTA